MRGAVARDRPVLPLLPRVRSAKMRWLEAEQLGKHFPYRKRTTPCEQAVFACLATCVHDYRTRVRPISDPQHILLRDVP